MGQPEKIQGAVVRVFLLRMNGIILVESMRNRWNQLLDVIQFLFSLQIANAFTSKISEIDTVGSKD